MTQAPIDSWATTRSGPSDHSLTAKQLSQPTNAKKAIPGLTLMARKLNGDSIDENRLLVSHILPLC